MHSGGLRLCVGQVYLDWIRSEIQLSCPLRKSKVDLRLGWNCQGWECGIQVFRCGTHTHTTRETYIKIVCSIAYVAVETSTEATYHEQNCCCWHVVIVTSEVLNLQAHVKPWAGSVG